MPPASLPALAVMTPGPRMARYRNKRGRRATVRRTFWAPRRKMRRLLTPTLVRSSDTWRVLGIHFAIESGTQASGLLYLLHVRLQSTRGRVRTEFSQTTLAVVAANLSEAESRWRHRL